MPPPIEPTRTTTKIWVALNLLHSELSQSFERAMRDANLPPPPWYDVLWGLERFPNGLRQFELQRHCLYDQPNLSRTLKRMVDQRLVEAQRASEDGRGRILSLTQEGRALRARMWQVYGQLMIETIEQRLDDDTASQLADGLVALLQDHPGPLVREATQP